MEKSNEAIPQLNWNEFVGKKLSFTYRNRQYVGLVKDVKTKFGVCYISIREDSTSRFQIAKIKNISILK